MQQAKVKRATSYGATLPSLVHQNLLSWVVRALYAELHALQMILPMTLRAWSGHSVKMVSFQAHSSLLSFLFSLFFSLLFFSLLFSPFLTLSFSLYLLLFDG